MKRSLFFIALTLMSLGAYATAQSGDVIYIEGEAWELLAKPVYADSVARRELREALPKERGWSTANWEGYTAYWSIQQETLCLDSVLYDVYDHHKSTTERLPMETLLRVFRKYVDGERIVFTCVNGDLRAAKGKQIYYEHSGFSRHYEQERFISIEQGKVCGIQDYQNYVVEGLSFDSLAPRAPKYNAEMRAMFPLRLEKYPELAGEKRIVFNIKRARVDAQGRLVECEVKVYRPDDNPRLAAEIAELLKAYHPWRVLYINGEFRAYGIEGYTLPYVFEE